MKLISRVRDKGSAEAIGNLIRGPFFVRVSPFLLSELFDVPFRKPDGRVVRMDGYDIWFNDETGEYEAAPQFTVSEE